MIAIIIKESKYYGQLFS